MEKALEILKHIEELYVAEPDLNKFERIAQKNPERVAAWDEAFKDYDLSDVLVAIDEFAGTIHIEDTYEPIVLDKQLATIIDTVTHLDISQIDKKIETLQDLWDVTGIGERDLAPLYDRGVAVNFAYVVYALVTDDGYAFVTDDGYTLTNSDGGWL